MEWSWGGGVFLLALTWISEVRFCMIAQISFVSFTVKLASLLASLLGMVGVLVSSMMGVGTGGCEVFVSARMFATLGVGAREKVVDGWVLSHEEGGDHWHVTEWERLYFGRWRRLPSEVGLE